MARTRTFLELQDDAYMLADEEGNTPRFPRSEVGRYVNEGCAECWGLMVEASPKNWAENLTPQSHTTTANTRSYTLANTTLKVLSVRLINGSYSYDLDEFGEDEEAQLEDSNISGLGESKYQIRRQTLYVIPPPAANQTLRVRFVPHHTDLSANADTWDAVLPGSDVYPAVYAARKMSLKNQEWDTAGNLGAELERLQSKIKSGAQNRNLTIGRKFSDTRGARFNRWFTRYR